jgi:hypothetical protein
VPVLADAVATASSELLSIDISQGSDSATLAPVPGSDIDPSSQGVTDTSTVAALHVGSAGLVSGAVTQVHPDMVDLLQPGEPLATGDLTHHATTSAATPVETADPFAAMTETASQPAMLPQASGPSSVGVHTLDGSAPSQELPHELALPSGGDATGEVSQPGNLTSDALTSATPVVDTTEPVLSTTAAVPSNPASDQSQPADAGNVTSDTHPNEDSVVDTSEPVLSSAGVSLNNPGVDLLHLAGVDTATSQASGSADTLLALATDAPIEVPGSATSAAANAAALDPVAVGGDVIALNDAPMSPINTLFTGTHYTEYGVTLSSIAVQPENAGASAEAALTETSAPLVVDVSQHSPSPSETVDTTHSIDHLGVRDAIL